MDFTLCSPCRLIGEIQSLGGTPLDRGLGTVEVLRPNGFITHDMCLVCDIGAEVGEGCESSMVASPASGDGAASNLVIYLIGADEYRRCPCMYSCPKGAKMGDEADEVSLSFLAAALLNENSPLSWLFSSLVDMGDCGIAPSIIGARDTGLLRSGPEESSEALRRMSVVATECCVLIDRFDPIRRLSSVFAAVWSASSLYPSRGASDNGAVSGVSLVAFLLRQMRYATIARRIPLRGATTRAIVWFLFKLASFTLCPGTGDDVAPPATPGVDVEKLDIAIRVAGLVSMICMYEKAPLQYSLVKSVGNVVLERGLVTVGSGGCVVVEMLLGSLLEVLITEVGVGVVVVVGAGAGGVLVLVVTGTVVRVLGVVVGVGVSVVVVVVVVVAGTEVTDSFG